MGRGKLCNIGIAAGTLAVLGFAQPVLAQAGGEQQRTVFEMFFFSDNALGLAVTWLLIAMSFCVMGLILKHLLDNRRAALLPATSVAAYEELLRERRFRDAIARAANDPTAIGRVMHASLSEGGNGYGAMERAIEEEGDLIGSRRSRAVEVLAVLGAVGPMIGLFGTVYGMIVAFNVIVEVGGQPDPAELADGISTALVTTFWGLIVGIPAVAAAALIRNRIDGMMVEVILQAEALIRPFSPSARKSAKGGGESSSRSAESGRTASPNPASPE